MSVYDRGETENGQLWIAMQYVEGTDAHAALWDGAMTPVSCYPVRRAERARLLADFGIARALDDIGLTVTGAVMATVAYAASEVLAGQQPFNRCADTYSLGCSLFRMLAGRTPFANSQGLTAVMMAHLQQPPVSGDARPFHRTP